MLLVLDNLEQVLDAAPQIAALLAACPALTVLATSRSQLRISGERTVDVPPLGLPEPAAGSTKPPLAALASAEAVRLFVERAQAARADFTLTESNAAVVAEICRRLDGLPLALELAAARTRVLPPAALLARLGQRLPLLTGGARDAPARLRTMRDAIEWSYTRLDAGEQALFRRLAAFSGGFTLAAAAAVVGSTGEDSYGGALERIASLVDKSLVRWEAGADGEPRYLMLETVREYGLEQLAASGDETDARDRHAAWCLALAVQAEPELIGAEQRRWSERLDVEHANLRAALAWLGVRGRLRGRCG